MRGKAVVPYTTNFTMIAPTWGDPEVLIGE